MNKLRFALVVPALDEEGAIAATLRRALAARQVVTQHTDVTEMTVVFVNDGSTDGTQDIVDQSEFDEVVKIRFRKNRGYGAAIKAGWQETDAELLGFIDADGTCDPFFCEKLVNRLQETNADVVLACRRTPESQMPLVRRIGNSVFAGLLGLVSGETVVDVASGFRIVRRSSMRLLTPLPDGLHFTPAMSAMSLLDPRLRIEEVPMPYKERIGQSKLSVVKDGLRFFWTILFTACCYAPIKALMAASGLFVLLMAPFLWMVSQKAGISWAAMATLVCILPALLAVGTSVAVHQLNRLLIGPRRPEGWWERTLQKVLDFRVLIVSGALLSSTSIAALILILTSAGSISGLAYSGLGMLTTAGTMMVLGGVIIRVIWAVREKHDAQVLSERLSSEPTINRQEASRPAARAASARDRTTPGVEERNAAREQAASSEQVPRPEER